MLCYVTSTLCTWPIPTHHTVAVQYAGRAGRRGRGRWRIGDIQKEADCGQMKVDTDEDALKAVNPSCRASPYVIMNTNPHHVSAGDDTVTPTRPDAAAAINIQPASSASLLAKPVENNSSTKGDFILIFVRHKW